MVTKSLDKLKKKALISRAKKLGIRITSKKTGGTKKKAALIKAIRKRNG